MLKVIMCAPMIVSAFVACKKSTEADTAGAQPIVEVPDAPAPVPQPEANTDNPNARRCTAPNGKEIVVDSSSPGRPTVTSGTTVYPFEMEIPGTGGATNDLAGNQYRTLNPTFYVCIYNDGRVTGGDTRCDDLNFSCDR